MALVSADLVEVDAFEAVKDVCPTPPTPSHVESSLVQRPEKAIYRADIRPCAPRGVWVSRSPDSGRGGVPNSPHVLARRALRGVWVSRSPDSGRGGGCPSYDYRITLC